MWQKKIELLEESLQGTLPGLKAHQTMMSYKRPTVDEVKTTNPNVRKGGVLMLLYPFKEELHTVLMLRPVYRGTHSAQVSFPGGAMEKEDPDIVYTALREAQEELGINPDMVKVLGRLSQVYIPPSNFLVTPIVGFTKTRPVFIPNATEVEAVIEAPVHCFLGEENIREKFIPVSSLNSRIRARYFDVNGHVVWGATAMMIAEWRVIAKEAWQNI